MATSNPEALAALSKKGQLGKYLKERRGLRKRAKKNQKFKVSEDGEIRLPENTLQQQCEEYLLLLSLRYIHVPDVVGRLCRVNDTRISLREKEELSYYFKGVSDLLIFYPRGKYTATLVLELKVGRNTCDADQREFLRYCLGDDWKRGVVRDFDTFRRIVDEFIAEMKNTSRADI